MKNIKIIFCLFLLSALIITGCSAEIKKEDSEPRKDVGTNEQLNDTDQQVENPSESDPLEVTELISKYKISVEEIIEAYQITDLHNLPRAGVNYPMINGVEPRAFNYLEGTLLAFIFDSTEECDKAIAKTYKNDFSSFSTNDASDLELSAYKINNGLIVYVPSYGVNKTMSIDPEWLIFYKEAKEEKVLTREMIRTLGNLGFAREEILKLSQEDIDRIFAPGTHLDGGGFDVSDLTEQEQKVLQELGISGDKAMILYNLGYEYEDMTMITEKELDLIFPNTELIAKLEKLGLTKNDIEEKLSNGASYKDIIKGCIFK